MSQSESETVETTVTDWIDTEDSDNDEDSCWCEDADLACFEHYTVE